MIRLRAADIALMAFMAVLIWTGCKRWPPDRPEWVPASSVFVSAPKGGYWQFCKLDGSGQCRCTIYLYDGRIVYDEAFLPYEGNPPTATQLVISPEGTGDTVKLVNGQLLLPESKYELVKGYWDSYGDWQRRQKEKENK